MRADEDQDGPDHDVRGVSRDPPRLEHAREQGELHSHAARAVDESLIDRGIVDVLPEDVREELDHVKTVNSTLVGCRVGYERQQDRAGASSQCRLRGARTC